MAGYEYKVIPAPAKGVKAPGVKGPEARFAHALEQAMNDLAGAGWEYLRADILPSEERQGLTSSHTVYRSVLVFRRALDGADIVLAEGSDDTAAEGEITAPEDETVIEADPPETAEADAVTEAPAEEPQPAR